LLILRKAPYNWTGFALKDASDVPISQARTAPYLNYRW